MPKKSKISPQDLETFHKAIKDTQPLSTKTTKLPLVKRASRSVYRPSLKAPTEPLNFTESRELAPVRAEEYIAYKQISVPHKILRKLKKGQYNVQAVLDLHGMSIEQTKIALDHFLHDCLRQGMRIVLIIHGKGRHSSTPILKNKLNSWLRHLDFVLAFCAAKPVHGGSGATYILLSQRKGHDG